MSIGDRIRAGCKALGISQAELARRTGQNPQDLQKILSGRTSQSKHFPNLALELKVDVDWLTTGKGNAPSWAPPDPSGSIEDTAKVIADLKYQNYHINAENQALKEDLILISRQLAAAQREIDQLKSTEKADVLAGTLEILKARRIMEPRMSRQLP